VLSALALGCAAAALAGAGCDPDRPRTTAVRIEPARTARAAESGSAGGASTPRPVTGGSVASSGAWAPVERSAADGERSPAEGARSAIDPSLAAPELEPGVNEEFDEDVLLDIDEALAAVDENAFAMLFKKVHVLVDGELVRREKFAHPDSCRSWRSLRKKGYAPKSALGKQIDAGALVRCGSLEFLAKARPSRRSHVRKLLLGADPSALPAIVASAPSLLAQRARDRAVAKGATLAELLPSARTVPSALPGRLSIAEPTSESSVILNAEVWGDINADGIEDIVLSVLNTTDDATYYDMRLIQVTRLSPSSPLTVLSVLD
jgi:hypothetical protein